MAGTAPVHLPGNLAQGAVALGTAALHQLHRRHRGAAVEATVHRVAEHGIEGIVREEGIQVCYRLRLLHLHSVGSVSS